LANLACLAENQKKLEFPKAQGFAFLVLKLVLNAKKIHAENNIGIVLSAKQKKTRKETDFLNVKAN
jgi:hypothetical protein